MRPADTINQAGDVDLLTHRSLLPFGRLAGDRIACMPKICRSIEFSAPRLKKDSKISNFYRNY